MVEERTVVAKLKGDVNPFIREMAKASAATKAFTKELDTSTDRSTMLTQSLLAVGPALVPISAAAVPAMVGLSNQMGFAVAGAGAMVLAFQGVGDALKATNEYAIDPTDANLQKMRESLAELGPAGQDFVGFLQHLRPALQDLQSSAQAGLFPGMESGITDLMDRLPQVERIVSEVSGTIGDLLAEAGANLASGKFDDFFDFLEREARPTLIDFGRTLGNLGEGFANLWMAFDPLSDSFSRAFLDMSRDFAQWTDGLDQTQGFQEFIGYIQRVGPKVWETLGALGNALLQIVEAAAPVGEVMLPAITALADVIATLANSDLAPLAIGLVSLTSAMSRVIALSQSANSSALGGLFSKSAIGGGLSNVKAVTAATKELATAQTALATNPGMQGLTAYKGNLMGVADAEKKLGEATKARNRQFISGGTGVATMAFVMSDLDEKMGLTSTAMGAMAGSLAGPWGTAVGAGIGLVMDLSSQTDVAAEAAKKFTQAFADTTSLEEQAAVIKAYKEQIAEAQAASPDGLLAGKAAEQIDKLRDGLAPLESQYAANQRAAQDLTFQEAGLGSTMDSASDSARNQAEAMINLRNEHNRAADAALTQRDAERAYQAAVDDAAESVKKNGATLDKHTPKGRANAEAIDQIIASFNKMDYATQQANGGLEAARAEFVKARVAAGGSADAAYRLATNLLEIKSPPPIKLSLLGAQTAVDVANNLGAALSRLHDKSITITTNRVGSSPGGTGPTKSGYTGMRVPQGFWPGGKVPGTPPTDPTEDNVLAMGATTGQPILVRSGEWIINQPQSDKNDPWLRAINNGLVLDDIFSRGAIPGFASGGRYDDFSALKHSTKLDIARQEQSIIDIQKSLDEQETYGKGKNKKKRDALRGHAREVAKLELQAAKAELAKMKRENAELKNYGTQDEEELRQKNADDAVQEAERVVREAADRFTSAKSSAVERFSIGSASSAAQVDRNLDRLLRDSQTFLGLLGDLKSKGASPWLLGELVKAGPTRGAIRLAREYSTNQAAFDSIQARASQIDQYTNAYAGLVGNSMFSAPAAWNSGISSASQAPMVASLVGAQISVGTNGLMQFVSGQILMSQDAQQLEARVTI